MKLKFLSLLGLLIVLGGCTKTITLQAVPTTTTTQVPETTTTLPVVATTTTTIHKPASTTTTTVKKPGVALLVVILPTPTTSTTTSTSTTTTTLPSGPIVKIGFPCIESHFNFTGMTLTQIRDALDSYHAAVAAMEGKIGRTTTGTAICLNNVWM